MTDAVEHWWCPACGTFDGPRDEGFCDVCADGTCIDGLVPRAEVERLQRIVDSVQSKTALDVVAEKMAAEDRARKAEAKVERLRGALEGIKARCDRIVAGEFEGLQAATEMANEARRALRPEHRGKRR